MKTSKLLQQRNTDVYPSPLLITIALMKFVIIRYFRNISKLSNILQHLK